MADENRSLHDDRARIRFAFDFDPLFRLAALPFGVAPDRAHVTVDDDRLIVRFGPWRLDTPLDNVVGAEVSGPFALPKVIGPPHLSLRDRGLTFATNARQGVCIRFGAPVAGLLPLPQLRHPAVTVTVAEAATLAALLDRERHDDRASDSG